MPAPRLVPVPTGCECGADRDCLPVWHEALALERTDPGMAEFHNPVVCAFLLQHRSHLRPRLADGQYRFLQLFLDRGVDSVNAVARRWTARNSGPAPAVDAGELAGYDPIPREGFPRRFRLSVHHLREPGGGFVAGGHAAYGQRVRDLAAATVEGWRAASGSGQV